ncbi:unnamed protein product [Phaedon cochleariae]|uniref:Uncharacterized protein n=1 Tax=Phaedon cochleariae TaxID=80249 RepID=A0A9P0DT58_PHACE|nr:unnamed protein product [Phaedon cochleariae]
MDERTLEYFNKTVISTPQPTASSTVNRRSNKRGEVKQYDHENSLSLLEEGVMRQSLDRKSGISFHLQQQRELASDSLYRANKVASIPSKYLRSVSTESATQMNFSCESTISESDLLKTPVNTSTPRNSIERQSLGDSLTQLSLKIKNPSISLDNFVSEFHKAMNSSKCDVPSSAFIPAEDAASMLLADEMSWQMKEALPIQEEQFSNLESSIGKMSLGEFFQCRSDTISDLSCAKSPVKTKKPVPLIDVSHSILGECSDIQINENKSLSITAIQKYLAQTEDTPRKVVDELSKQDVKSIRSSMNKSDDNSSLPVSKNSSYTSDHSDNEVLNCIVNKENLDTMNIRTSQKNSSLPLQSSSRASSRASSTLTSLTNGKLPIDTTKCDLIWGCIKLGKSITQDFIIRNRSSKRLGLQLSIFGQEFKIMKDNRVDGEALSSVKLILHPHESKTILISFIPTRVGAAMDEILFTSLEPKLQQTKKQCVRLFGYGGYGKIEFANLTRDTTGRFWLSLGKLDSKRSAFEVKSTGVLPTFAHISFNSKKLSNVTVVPNFFVLIPGEQKEVVVTYQPSAEDYKTLQNSLGETVVMDLGSLLITSGTEVDRGRLRRLCRKCIEAGSTLDSLSNVLRNKLQGEVMPPDLVKFQESTDRMKDILKLFTCHEVIVTIERDPDQTIMPQYSDESGLFQSLYQDTIVANESFIGNSSCRLEPSVIFLTPPSKITDSLFFSSESDKKLHFEISASPQGLEVNPTEGELLPNGECIITLKYQITECEKKQFKVHIFVEQEVFEAVVRVIPVYQTKSK